MRGGQGRSQSAVANRWIATSDGRNFLSEPANHPLAEWELTEAFEYSRHYDNLVWLVTSLFTTANVALLAIAAGEKSIEVSLAGLALSVLTAYFATSFRLLRRRVHLQLKLRGMDCEWLYESLPGIGAQWLIYVAFFAGLATLWTWRLIISSPGLLCVWIGLLAASLAVFMFLYRKARRMPGQVQNNRSS